MKSISYLIHRLNDQMRHSIVNHINSTVSNIGDYYVNYEKLRIQMILHLLMLLYGKNI